MTIEFKVIIFVLLGNNIIFMSEFFLKNIITIFQDKSINNIDYKNILDFKIIWSNTNFSYFKINKIDVKIRNGDFIILMPGHQIEFKESTEMNLNIISFSVDYLQIAAKGLSIDLFKLFIKNSTEQVLRVQDDDVILINTILKMIFNLNSEKVVDQQISINLINSILLLIIRNNHSFVSSPYKYIKRIHDFFMLIFEYSKREKKVTFYANQLSISPKRLNQILQNFTGHSASYFIHEHLVIQAKELLITSEKNINEISIELGFEDVAYFSRFFKRLMNKSPENYRKSIQDSHLT